MLRCLIRVRNASTSCLRLIFRPSSTLTTIRTYGKIRDFIRVDSSSTKPSRFNLSGSHFGGDASTDGDASGVVSPGVVSPSVVFATVVAFVQSSLGESLVIWLDGSRGDVGAALSLEAALPAFRRAAVLSFFLFAWPWGVLLCFLPRALAHWRLWCSRQPKGQRRFSRPALRG